MYSYIFVCNSFDIDIRYVDVLMIGVRYLNFNNSEPTTTLIIDLA